VTGNNTIGTRPGDFIVGRIDTDGRPTADMHTALWTAFLNGHWQKKKPSSPGVYPVANRHGKVVGEALFQADCEGNIVSMTHDNWDGWFFSTPMPKLPVRPPELWPEESTGLRLVRPEE